MKTKILIFFILLWGLISFPDNSVFAANVVPCNVSTGCTPACGSSCTWYSCDRVNASDRITHLPINLFKATDTTPLCSDPTVASSRLPFVDLLAQRHTQIPITLDASYDVCTPHVVNGTACCTPTTTCAAQGKNCGSILDGCGGIINCGTCTAPLTCQTNQTCGAPVGCTGINNKGDRDYDFGPYEASAYFQGRCSDYWIINAGMQGIQFTAGQWAPDSLDRWNTWCCTGLTINSTFTTAMYNLSAGQSQYSGCGNGVVVGIGFRSEPSINIDEALDQWELVCGNVSGGTPHDCYTLPYTDTVSTGSSCHGIGPLPQRPTYIRGITFKNSTLSNDWLHGWTVECCAYY